MSTIHTRRWSISTEADQIEVTSNAPRLDPAWEHVDVEGHVHSYGDHGSLPSLTWVVDHKGGVYCDEDGYPEEYPDEGHWECTLCREHIEPGMRGPSMVREYISGPVRATLHTDEADYYLTSEDMQELKRRMSMTRDHAIRDRIVEQFIEAHRDQRIA